MNKYLTESYILKEIENLKAKIQKLEHKVSSNLEYENNLRSKNNIKKVSEVTKLEKLPHLKRSLGLKFANNSYNYYLNYGKIVYYKKFIEEIKNSQTKAEANDNLKNRINSLKNILDNQYDNYTYSLIDNTMKFDQVKLQSYSKSRQRKHVKQLKRVEHKINKYKNILFTLLQTNDVEKFPNISDIEIVNSNDAKLTKNEKETLSVKEKKNNHIVNTLYKYHKYVSTKQGLLFFEEDIKKSNHFIQSKMKQQNVVESLLSDYNYQISKYYKEKEIQKLEIDKNNKLSIINTKIEDLKLKDAAIDKNILSKLEKTQNQLSNKINKFEDKCSKIDIHKQQYKELKVKISNLKEKQNKVEKEIECIKQNHNPHILEKIDNLMLQKQKITKQTKRLQANAGSKKQAFSRLLGLLKPFKKSLIAICVVIIFSTIFQIMIPVMINVVFSNDFLIYLINAQGVVNIPNLLIVFGLFILFYLIVFVLNFMTEFIASKLGGLISYNLRRNIKEKIDRLPLAYFDTTQIGDLLSRVTNDTDLIASSIHTIISQTIKSFFLLFGVIIAMLVIQWELAFIALGTIPLALIVVFLVAMKSQKEFVRVQKITGNLNAQIEEVYSGYKVVKLFNQETNMNLKFSIENTKLQKAGLKSQFLSGCIQPLLNAVHNVGYVFVCVVGGLLGAINSIVSFMIFLNLFQQPIQQMAQISNIFQQTIAASNRVFEVLDAKEEVEDLDNSIDVEKVEGLVDFEHVDFSYNKENPLIQDMNLKVNKGDSIAIVGPTGAGKTTLVNLIMRFYDVTNGSLKIDNVDIRNYKRSSIRKQIGMVLQDTWLFNGTIAENIAYGKDNATKQEIIEASKKARAHHFIQTLENGYDTVINEEASNISQGQKQLITIARAIISNPNIMILDEATSSVDTRTEKALQDAMNDMMEGRTSFVIAHRLSTIKNSKMILVMNKGNIVEQGNHKELLAKNGFYAELYNAQFMGATNDKSVNNS